MTGFLPVQRGKLSGKQGNFIQFSVTEVLLEDLSLHEYRLKDGKSFTVMTSLFCTPLQHLSQPVGLHRAQL